MNVTTIYTDGGCVKKNPSKIAGTWAWVGIMGNIVDLFSEANREFVGGLDANATFVRSDSGYVFAPEDGEVTNNQMEYLAVLQALESMPDGWSGEIVSDSLITVGRFSQGWRNKGLPDVYVERQQNVMFRMGAVTFRHVDGHPTAKQLLAGIGKRGNNVSRWNVMADRLCTQEAEKALNAFMELYGTANVI